MANKNEEEIEEIDEAIKKLSKELDQDIEILDVPLSTENMNDNQVENNETHHDTKELENLNQITSKEENEKIEHTKELEYKLVDEKSNNDSNTSDDNIKISNKNKEKKNTKKIIIITVILVIILILGITLAIVLKTHQKQKTVVNNDLTLSKSKQKKLINNYGEALENVIAIYYEGQQVILKYEDAIKLVDFEDNIICKEHEIYDDGKVYLNKCSINGKKTTYSFGSKQVKKEVQKDSNDNLFYVYINKKENYKILLNKPDDENNYDKYKITCDNECSEIEIIGTMYVSYFDKDYNVVVKEIKNDTKVLSNLNYKSVLPIKRDYGYDTLYIAVNVNDSWGIYDLKTGNQVVQNIYESICSNLNLGVSGPVKYIETLGTTSNIAVVKNNKIGVINYTNGNLIIDTKYKSVIKSGNYLNCGEEYNSLKEIYDFNGNKYLTSGYDKIYGIVDGIYILVEENNETKMIQLDGKTLYNYGDTKKHGKLNFSISYNNGAIFQFYKNDNDNQNCLEYVYNNNKGEIKEEACGGIAKPILYLYPKKKTKVTVSFSHPEYLETTYPKFINKWEVTAYPNGDLYDKNNKYYYGLYWDEKKVHTTDFSTGFYVEKDNAIDFLEEKLEIIGLNKKERNEFIMYWLPILEKNGKNLVYFELTEERESYNKINITPTPDSLLRIVIHVKKVDKKINLKEEKLTKFKRSGFTAIEWGGTIY